MFRICTHILQINKNKQSFLEKKVAKEVNKNSRQNTTTLINT